MCMKITMILLIFLSLKNCVADGTMYRFDATHPNDPSLTVIFYSILDLADQNDE